MRRTLFERAAETDALLGLAFWVMFMTCSVALAAVTCKYVSREAVGSGIPNIRVIMDGFMLSNFFTLRTLLAKIVGLIFTLGSGIPIGKEVSFKINFNHIHGIISPGSIHPHGSHHCHGPLESGPKNPGSKYHLEAGSGHTKYSRRMCRRDCVYVSKSEHSINV